MININDLMKQYGLINILELDPSIKVDIRYATPNNFVGKVLYSTPFDAYAQQNLAIAVVKANQYLKQILPNLSIIIFDAARPISVQQQMFELVKDTPYERYIANPYCATPGGFHNYGMAIDLSIVDENNKLLDMGTDFDSFSELAHVGNERDWVLKGKLTYEAYANRMLLYSIMGKVGLLPYQYEWWHYQLEQDDKDKLNKRLLDF